MQKFTEEQLRAMEIEREKQTISLSKERFNRNNGNLMEYHRGGETQQGRVVIARLCAPLAQAIQEFVDPKDKFTGWNAGCKYNVRDILRPLPLTYSEIAFCTLKAVLNEYFRPDSRCLISNHAYEICRLLIVAAEYKDFEMNNKKEAKALTKRVMRKRGGSNNRYGYTTLKTARETCGLSEFSISHRDQLMLGTKLIELLIESTGSFYIDHLNLGKRNKPAVLRASEELLSLVQKCADWFSELKPPFPVMLVRPNEWQGMSGGGYLLPLRSLHPALIKASNSELTELKKVKFPHVVKAVNSIQNTAWKINRDVFAVAQELWNRGGGVAGMAPVDILETPPKPWPSDCSKEEFDRWKSEHKADYFAWSGKAQQIHKENKRNCTARLRVSYQLRIAKENLEFERIYFPWNCDFRGRMYAIPSYVSPQSDDLGKALITFAETKPIGEVGAYWLRVHLANCAGVDKVSNEERVSWVYEHERQIVAVAENPLDFLWWADMDSPFQFLAACCEYAGFLREGSSFQTSLPIAMDGTCNGLQHLSAILRDPVGGKSVNLIPSMKPSDIYTDVLHVLQKKVEFDRENAEENETKLIAEAWLPNLDRAIVKRPVMTTPYGVSHYGITDQILDVIVEKKLFLGYAFTTMKFAKYLTKRLSEAIGEVITAAPRAMGWLQESANIIADNDDEFRGIFWTAPLSGFPVLQRYHADTGERIQLFVGSQRIQVCTGELSEKELNTRRQVSGISPNVIHSLDAAMLVETVNRMSKTGIKSFAMIHDSYGTHACDIPVMHEILRHVFVTIYSDRNVLQELKNSWESLYGVKLPEVPEMGSLDLRQTNYSRYFFA